MAKEPRGDRHPARHARGKETQIIDDYTGRRPAKELDTLQSLPGWCLVINMIFHVIWLATALGAGERLVRRQANWFAIDPDQIRPTLYQLLAMYKTVIIVFNFASWSAIMIVNR